MFFKNETAIVATLIILALGIRFIWLGYFLPPSSSAGGLYGDEAVYVASARRMLSWFQEGRLQLTPDLQYNFDSPMFAKILFAIGISVFGQSLADATAARLVSITVGTIGTVAIYFLIRRIFQDSTFAFAGAVSFSFSPAFFATSTTGLLDAVSVTFAAVSFLLILKKGFAKVRSLDVICSGVFLGFAIASKFLALTAAIIGMTYLLSQKEISLTRRILQVVLCGAIALFVFFLVQPRLWFDPSARLFETWSFWASEFSHGHPIPLSTFPGGNDSWSGPRSLPPWWIMTYWTALASTPFQFIGIILLCESARKVTGRIGSPRVWFPLITFFIPLFYLTAQTIKLPQYLTLLALGETLVSLLGYEAFRTGMRRLIVPLSITTVLSPFEPLILGWGINTIFNILFPIWLRLLEWVAILCVVAIYRLGGRWSFEASKALRPV